jgi:hypothetical protein
LIAKLNSSDTINERMNNDALDDGRNTIEIDKKLKTRSFNLI